MIVWVGFGRSKNGGDPNADPRLGAPHVLHCSEQPVRPGEPCPPTPTLSAPETRLCPASTCLGSQPNGTSLGGWKIPDLCSDGVFRGDRVRHASPNVGRHQYRTECSDTTNADLHGREGELDVQPYEGGYVPGPDHSIPPDVSFAHYYCFMDKVPAVL